MKTDFWNKKTIEKIRQGYYSAVYFNRTKHILLEENNLKPVTMQIFQDHDGSVLCGIKQVRELLRIGTGYFKDNTWISKWDTVQIKALSDGDMISQGEPVMHITAPYVYLAHLESLYLGILARLTRIATNVRHIVDAANGKQVLFFADRFDYFFNQEADGYAAFIGGVTNICTEAQGIWINEKAAGTMPHALIAINNSNTNETVRLYAKYYPESPLVALVDFDNDCIATSLQAAREFGTTLWGIRIDTAKNLVDKSLQTLPEKNKELHGVNPTLVKLLRSKLDMEGFSQIKIIVSGGFTREKIIRFEEEQTPVDIYAVGSAIFDGKNDFTADIVGVNGKERAKTGRRFVKNNRLQ